MEEPVKISLISYTNTKPFVWGILNSRTLENQVITGFDSPAECARKLIHKEVDLGIVPVAALLDIPGYHILSDYCIGSDGDVNSVFLFSQVPVEEIRTIQLDPQSRTSNNLTRILCKYLWKIEPDFLGKERFEPGIISQEDNSFSNPEGLRPLSQNEAKVLIGDRTFSSRKDYRYHYDLGGEWKRLTGLPFVFAVWASHKDLSLEFQNPFNTALKWGLDHRAEVIDQILSDPSHNPDMDYSDYLFQKLSFDFNDSKKKALNLYLDYLKIEKGVPQPMGS